MMDCLNMFLTSMVLKVIRYLIKSIEPCIHISVFTLHSVYLDNNEYYEL